MTEKTKQNESKIMASTPGDMTPKSACRKSPLVLTTYQLNRPAYFTSVHCVREMKLSCELTTASSIKSSISALVSSTVGSPGAVGACSRAGR